MFNRNITVNDALDFVLDEQEPCDLYLEPPEVAELTDEDSGEEESFSASNLTGNQLRAGAEIQYQTRHDETASDDENDEERRTPPAPKMTKQDYPTASKFSWTPKQTSSSFIPLFPEANYCRYRDFGPLELFELFFDEPLYDLIVEQSNVYCQFKNLTAPPVTKEEIKVFFAILVVSGYNPHPSKADFWTNGDDLRNTAVYMAMRRNRFDHIMRILHFKDNTQLNVDDKYTKLRPLISYLQKKFMLHYVPTRNIAHDEAMVEYFGKHSCKQAIRNKPIRFGYKVWCQNNPSGYLIAFDPYQGKTYEGCDEEEKIFGRCSSTVLHLLRQYSDDKTGLPYCLNFDNLFTSLPLIHELKKRGYDSLGTIRQNRLGKNCTLNDVKSLDKQARGSYDSATATYENNNVLVTRWKDNAVLTLASSAYGVHPIGSKRRWSKAEKKNVYIDTPFAVCKYNDSMGGTDRMDQNINAYRISIRGKKWWWCLFTWLLDVSINNAWLLSKAKGDNYSQLQFRRAIVKAYLSRYGTPPKGAGRKPAATPDTLEKRYDRLDHFAEPTNENKKRRCAYEGCKSIGRTQSKKCDVGLCVKCFAAYHTK